MDIYLYLSEASLARFNEKCRFTNTNESSPWFYGGLPYTVMKKVLQMESVIILIQVSPFV